MDIQHPDDLTLGLKRYRQLRASFAAFHPDIAWLLANVGHQQGFARTGHPAGDACPAYFKSRRCKFEIGIIPGFAGSNPVDNIIVLNKADSDMVIIKGVSNQTYNLGQHLLYLQDRRQATAYLADGLELLRSSLLGLEEAGTLNGQRSLIGHGQGQLPFVGGEAPLLRPLGA